MLGQSKGDGQQCVPHGVGDVAKFAAYVPHFIEQIEEKKHGQKSQRHKTDCADGVAVDECA